MYICLDAVSALDAVTDRKCRAVHAVLLTRDHNTKKLACLFTAKPVLGRSVFSSPKQVFLAQYCQISTELDKIFCTPIVVPNSLHLWADLDRDRRVGGSRPNDNDYIFENL